MFPIYGRSDRTDHERYLQDELDREREASQERERRLDEDRERRRKEDRQEREQAYRYASNWPEAFEKQASLCWREQHAFPDQSDDYFEKLARANEQALEFWKEIAIKRQAEIDAIWEQIRNEVADKLEAASERPEYKQTAQAVRDDDLASYLDW